MKRTFSMVFTAVAVLLAASELRAQHPANPILFVTLVPTPQDSATLSSLFGNHGANMQDAPRGGDLWIRYPDGTTKNLTRAAGYGVDGLQGAGAIAVREPSVYWNGTKALFSMVVGGAAGRGDTAKFFWQIYEITGLGQQETPVIAKVPNQPAGFNNVSPIYGTDDRIIFTSDRTRTGERHLYPAFDEYKGAPTNSGLWSLDPVIGDLFQLDNSPSGDFTPTIDSYGRLLVMRWDRLQRDRNADMDVLGTGVKGTFNYSDESAGATAQYGVRSEYYPEPQSSRTDLLAGTNMVGFEFNQFFPWQINEDGTTPETLNHLGRHDMRQVFNAAITGDANVVAYNYANTGRKNRNPINNFMQVKEDPNNPGTYYGVDALQVQTHSGGEIISLNAAPTLDPNETMVTYVTNRATQGTTPEGGTPNPNHSGFYRNPLPLSDGVLIAAHSPDTHADKNLGTRANPVSRFTYRLTTLKQGTAGWVADQALTSGISKSVTYWDPDTLVHFNGTLWELDPVEVRARQRPARRSTPLPSQEKQILDEEGVDEAGFRAYLTDKNLAVTVTRDVTHRDAADHQQPFYLRIAGTSKQSANPTGTIYDISHMQFFQGDYLRGQGLTSPTATPHPGRRILALPMHDAIAENPVGAGGPNGSVKLAEDGSMASFVPARHAVSWQLISPTGAPVVRERYWVTFQPGEIRVCASCHGTNDLAATPINPIPQNKPDAFRELVRTWKANVIPSHVALLAPANGAAQQQSNGNVRWRTDSKADSYEVQISSDSTFATTVVNHGVQGDTARFMGLAGNRTYYWRVLGRNQYGNADWSDTWSFTTADNGGLAVPTLRVPQNGAIQVPLTTTLSWMPVEGATTYHFQIALSPDFSLPIGDVSGVADTSIILMQLRPNRTHYWRVSTGSGSGAEQWSEVWSFTTVAPSGVAAERGDRTAEARISVHPDPFASSTAIDFTTPTAGPARLTLFDAHGSAVATLLDRTLPAGDHTVRLSVDDPALRLPAGIYLLRLETGEQKREQLLHVVR